MQAEVCEVLTSTSKLPRNEEKYLASVLPWPRAQQKSSLILDISLERGEKSEEFLESSSK